MDELVQSSATIAATESLDNARAGVIYVGSTGELSGMTSSDNQFGLVLQPGKCRSNLSQKESETV